jgi:bacillopeptidase F
MRHIGSRHRPAVAARTFGAALLIHAAASAAGAGTVTAELEQILAQTAPTTRVPVLFMLAAQVDPGEVAGSSDPRAACVARLVEALKTQAITTQNAPASCGAPGLIDELVAGGATSIRQFMVTNAVHAEVTPPVINQAALRADLSVIAYAGDREVEVGSDAPAAPQWNIDHVGAPSAWALGHRGAGGIVAAIDTGGNATHPDLAPNLLLDGSGAPVWRDAVSGLLAPYDEDGHGSHMLGIAVGKNGIGVAPDARWMACKAFTRSGGRLTTNAARILECANWILGPGHTDLTDTTPPDPALIPDAVLVDLAISAAGYCDPFLQNAIRAWRACGIMPVFSVGDHPTQAPVGAVPSPANDPMVFSVGAADANDVILPTTYRGLAFCPGPLASAPRLVAPGVDILSAWTGAERRLLGGSDAAAAHVAGAVALVRGAHPDTRRVSTDIVDQALVDTAVAVADGQRRLDVLAAVTHRDAEFMRQLEVPATFCLRTGQGWPTTVTFRNAGLGTWRQGTHELRYVGPPSPWGTGNGIALPVAEVLPGQEIQWLVPVIAPMVPNESPGYRFEWQVCEVGGGCFGARSPAIDVCVEGVDGAAYVGDPQEDFDLACAPPNVWGAALISFRNTGTTTWKGNDGYALGKLGNFDDPDAVALGGDVPPGATKDFVLSYTGPFPAGRHTLSRRMRRAGAWFGDTQSIVIDTNTCSTDDSSLAGTNDVDLGEVRVGQSRSLSLQLINTGQSTWRSGYCLKAVSGPSWGTAAQAKCLTGSQTVVPGGSFTFPLLLVAPNNPGRWPVRYRLYDDFGNPFGAVFDGTLGIPRDHRASLEFASVQGAYNWFYRYYAPSAHGWKKLGWKADATQPGGGFWRRDGSDERIWQQRALPGDMRAVARFWKSPTAGWVRVSGTAADLEPGCGDGFKLTVRKNSEILSQATVPNGGSQAYTVATSVALNDTIRVTVGPNGNNNCDLTLLDPLVQVVPPFHPTTGFAPSEGGTVANQETEPGEE